MLLTDEMCHSASIVVEAEAKQAYAFISDPLYLGIWAFGSWESRPFNGDIHEGVSLFTGGRSYSRLTAYPSALQVDFEIGSAPDALVPRIVIRILPGRHLGLPPEHCLVTVLAWRSQDADEQRWRLTCASHETEVFRLKHVIENQVG
ncbi:MULTISPECIES: hypothetical protein [unclassified Sphingomonas]|uniref:hypothetical protein n=1 Tax=unclassified Sphingomonas TaxID=196159 RepID=UPI000AAAA64F|nr:MULTISPECIES: hypothetical protein [unclassified Sphingomonas]